MPPPRRKRRTRDRLLRVTSILLLIALVASGIRVWQIVDAAVNAERTMIVPIDGESTEPSHQEVIGDLIGAGADSEDPGRSEVWNGKTALTVLVAGVDRRPDGGDQNADVLIIARIDLLRKSVSGVSIPRDLLVDVPGYGQSKINGAYNLGHQANPNDPAAGIKLTVETVEAAYAVKIDGYVLIDFTGFKDVVDALGGIDVTVPCPIDDADYPTEDYGTQAVHFDAGPQHMDGERALIYVRTRHGDSDDARRERQIQVLLALFDQGKSLSSITRADKIIEAGGKSIQTSFSVKEQLTLARLALDTDRGDIRLTTLGEPLLTGGFVSADLWAYTGDPAEVRAFVLSALEPSAAPAAASPTVDTAAPVSTPVATEPAAAKPTAEPTAAACGG